MKHFLCSVTFFFSPRKSWSLRDNVEIYCRTRQATNDSIIWHMRFGCWMTSQTHPQNIKYLLLLFTNNRFANAPLCYVFTYKGESNENLKVFFYLVICWIQKVHNDFIFLCSNVLPPVGHSSNHEYHCYQLTRQSSCVSNFYRAFKGFHLTLPRTFRVFLKLGRKVLTWYVFVNGQGSGLMLHFRIVLVKGTQMSGARSS